MSFGLVDVVVNVTDVSVGSRRTSHVSLVLRGYEKGRKVARASRAVRLSSILVV